MESRLLLDVVVGQRSSVLQLLSSEDETLLVRRNTFLVLYLSLDVLNRVAGFDLQGDGLPGEGLDKDLHSSPEPQHEMESRLLLDVIVGQSSSVLQLLTSEDKSLLVRRNSFFVLDLGLDVLDRVTGLHLQGDGLPGERLHEDLHSSPEPQHEMESGLLLDVVIRQSSSVLQLLSSEDETLLVRRNSFLVLNLGLDVFNRVAGLNLQSDSLAGESFDEDLHDA